MFTGSGAAGKTSFGNLLMKNKFINLHHSTNIVQAKNAVSVKKAVVLESSKSDDKNIVWLEIDNDSHISQLRQILFALNISSPPNVQMSEQPSLVSQPPQLSNIAMPNTVQENNTQAVSCIKQCKVETQKKFSVAKRVTEMFQRSAKNKQQSVKTEMLASFSTLVEGGIKSSKTELSLQQFGEILNIITLLDTGGQPEYIHLLPTVNVNPIVTFVVHDLSRSLEDQVLVEFSEHGKLVFEPYHLKYCNFDTIKFLMSSINDSLERTSSQAPQLVTIPGKNNQSYICCVGTHADKVSSNVIQNTDSQLTAMVEKLNCKAAVWRNKDGVLFPVDNTTAGDDSKEDHIANVVRNRIDSLASLKDIYELPITWMLFELEIRQLCSSNDRAYISVQDCIFIAIQSGLITNEDEVKDALTYHHLLGVLLYYPEVDGLCDYVIVDHQWLFDRISNIVCFTFKQYTSNLHAQSKLKRQGILTQELLQELKWKEELKEQYFIALLVEMNIVAPIEREHDNGEDYFIPYILPPYSSQSQCDGILFQYGFLQGEPLLVQFQSNLLPRGFFCCLAVQILQQLPQGWSHSLTLNDTYPTYSNLMTFRLANAYSLSLIDKLSYLQVEIRHQESNYYHKYPVHIAIKDVLTIALEYVCEKLLFNQNRLQYGFPCQCRHYMDQHIALLTGLNPPFDYALCRYGSVIPTKLEEAHTVWLINVSQNDYFICYFNTVIFV